MAKKQRVRSGPKCKLTPEVRRKLEEAASLGCSVEEMSYYIGIHKATIYRWMQNDEKLRDDLERLEQHTILKARKSIVDNLTNPEMAFRYLERKRPKEFGMKTQSEVAVSGTISLTDLYKQAQQIPDDQV